MPHRLRAPACRRAAPMFGKGSAVALLATLVLVLGSNPAWATLASAPDPGISGVNGRVWSIVRIGNVVYLGGTFTAAIAPDGTTVPRNYLAAIDTTTGELTSWAPQVDGKVFTLATDGSSVFAGGDFLNVNGTPRAYFAGIAQDGSLLPWQPDVTNRVRALAVDGSTLYLGGSFTRVDGKHHGRLAALDLASSPTPGALLAWSPSTDRTPKSIAPLGNGNVVIGGIFTEVNGDLTQQFIAELKPDGTLAAWASHPIDYIWSVFAANGTLYAGRGGINGGTILAYDPADGTLLWDHGADGDIQAVGFADGKVIVGGHFGNIHQQHVPKLAAFNPDGTFPSPNWIPWPNSAKGVWAMLGTGDKLYVGGDFTMMGKGTIVSNHFAQFSIS